MSESLTARATEFVRRVEAFDVPALDEVLAENASWWVDTGGDRAAGDFDGRVGAPAKWPFHGWMDARDRIRHLADHATAWFPGGLQLHVIRVFSGGDVAVVEVTVEAGLRDGSPFVNQHCLLVSFTGSLISSVREYLDTSHVAHHLDDALPPETRSEPVERIDPPDGAGARVAAAFIDAVTSADGNRLLAMTTDDATWWADEGPIRAGGGPDGPLSDDVGSPFGKALVRDRADKVSILAAIYPGGYELRPHRVVVDDDYAGSGLVAVEAAGFGARRSGVVYQNRYAFVLRATQQDQITEVREYCDTLHGFAVNKVGR